MSDQLSRTNDTPLHMEPPKTEDQAAEALTGKALTLEYRPARANALAISESDSGRFGAFSWRVLHDIESMICHPDVAQPYSYYKAGISSVKFEVTAQTMEQAKFAHELLTRVWERHLDQLQYAYDYGWCGYELTYTDDDHGRMDLDQILDLHPLDVWAVTRKGQYRGLRLKPSGLSSLPSGGILRLQGSTDLWGPGKWPAKALWLTHERRFDRFYGRTQLLGAWRPWMRLAGRDGAEDVLDGCLYRVGYQGPEIRYPPEDFKKAGGGVDYDAVRNEARQMAEQAKSGFSVALPSTYHQGGQPKWEVKFPTSAMSGIGTFLDWESNLQKQISRGVGVPPELLEASDTGSGYSGRKIPLLGFYESQLKNARNIVRALVDQVVLPLLKWNWGDDAWAEVKVDLEPPAAITGDKEQAQGGMPPQGAMPPEMLGVENMPPSPDGQQGMGGLEDLLPDEESSGGPGLAQLLGGELSTIAEAPDDPTWLDPGLYPADDRDHWSVSIGGYELASADGGSYEQRQITSGPRAGQSGWYNTQSQKFMPADWSPGQQGQQGQQGSQPQQGREVRQPSAPLPVTIQRQPLPSQSQSQPQQQAASQYPQRGGEVRAPSAPLPAWVQSKIDDEGEKLGEWSDSWVDGDPRSPTFGRLISQKDDIAKRKAANAVASSEVRPPSAPLSVTKQRPPLPSQDPSQPEQPKQPKQSKPRETAIIPKEKADDFRRVVDAASKDLSNKEHPLHVSRMRSQLAHADFGAGPVKTLRPTKDAPLSKSDHEAMDRAHSRAAAVLNMAGRNKEANAQLAAAKYHRGLSERKNVTAQKPAATSTAQQPLPSWLHTPKQQIPAPPPGWKKEHMGMSSDRAGRAAREEALKGGADANTAMRIGRAVSQHVYDYSLHAPNVEKRVLASDRNAQVDHQAVLKELRKRLPEMQSMHRKYMQEGYGASGRELSTTLQPPVFTLSAAQSPNDPEDVLDAVAGRARTLTRQARAALLAAVEAAPYGQALTAARRWADEWSGELAELLGETRLAAILHGMDGIASQLDADTLPLTGQPELAEDSTLPLVKEAANRLAGMQLLGMPGYLSAKGAAQNAATVEAEQMTAEAIGKVRSALARSIEEGGTLAEFKADLKEAFSEGVLTPDHVTEQVFRTNVMAAYSDGQERLLADPLVGDLFPYRAYYATHDDRTREEHLGMEKHGIDGTNIYRADDPVWQMFRPPWSWACRCSFAPVSVAEAARRGIQEAVAWLATGVEPVTKSHVPMPPWKPDDEFLNRGVELSTDPDYPVADINDWSDPTGYELAAPDSSRYQQRKVTRGPRRGQTAWYDSQRNRIMPANWKPSGEKAAKPTPKAGKTTAAKTPKAPAASVDELHEAITTAAKSGKPVNADDVKALADRVKGMKGADIQALRTKLGLSRTGGGSTKEAKALDLAKKMLAGDPAKATKGPKTPPAGKQSTPDAPKASTELADFERGLPAPKDPVKYGAAQDVAMRGDAIRRKALAAGKVPEVDENRAWQAANAAYTKLDGMAKRNEIPLPTVPKMYELAKQQMPELTRARFYDLLEKWQKDDRLTMQVVNDPHMEPEAHLMPVGAPGTERQGQVLGYLEMRQNGTKPSTPDAPQPQPPKKPPTKKPAVDKSTPAPKAPKEKPIATPDARAAQRRSTDPFEGHPNAGKSIEDVRKAIVAFASQQSSVNANTNPLGLQPAPAPPQTMNTAMSHVVAALKANSFKNPKISELYELTKKSHPELTVKDFQSALLYMHGDGKIRLMPHTQSPNMIPDDRVRFIIPRGSFLLDSVQLGDRYDRDRPPSPYELS